MFKICKAIFIISEILAIIGLFYSPKLIEDLVSCKIVMVLFGLVMALGAVGYLTVDEAEELTNDRKKLQNEYEK